MVFTVDSAALTLTADYGATVTLKTEGQKTLNKILHLILQYV